MKSVVSYLLFVLVIVALYGFAFSFAEGTEPAGKKVFVDKKCGTCHSVEAAGLESKKKDAVDLSNAGANKVEVLTTYLKKESKLNDKEHKTSFKGTDQELKDLTTWLSSLKTKGKGK